MIRDFYTDGVIELKRFTPVDEKERLEAVRDSIESISRFIAIFPENYTEEENRSWLQINAINWEEDREYCFKISFPGSERMIGEARLNYLRPIHKVANVTYWVRKGEEGKGIATRAVKILAGIGLGEMMYNRLELWMSVENTGSKLVAEKAGAKLEGIMRNRMLRNGEPEHAYLYSIIPEDII